MKNRKYEIIHNHNTTVIVGHKAMNVLKQKLEENKQPILIITGKSSAQKSGALKDLIENLEYNKLIQYNKITTNPTISVICELKQIINTEKPMSIIAIGGGSVIDSAKAAIKLASYDRINCKEYEIIEEKLITMKPNRINIVLYTVNLTHGTGSEANSIAVITFRNNLKIGFRTLYPTLSIDDPAYTLSMPPYLVTATSIDALAHAIEAATSIKTTRYVQLHSMEAAHIIIKYLPKALQKPNNLAYRYWLLYANILSGISIDYAGTHLPHLLENALSGLIPDIHHGVGLITLYKHLLQEIYKCCPLIMSKILQPLDKTLKPSIHEAQKAQKAFNNFIDSLSKHANIQEISIDHNEIKEIINIIFGNKYYKSLYNNSPLKYTREELSHILRNLI